MQADIAGRVAQALDVALGAGEQQALAREADPEPRGLRCLSSRARRLPRVDWATPSKLRQAIGYYEQAVALDSELRAGVGPALARRIAPVLQRHARTRRRRRRAALAAEQGVALGTRCRPRPTSPSATIYELVTGDYRARRWRSTRAGLRLAPTNADLLASSALAEQSLGRWDAALATSARAQRSTRARSPARGGSHALLWLRRYPEALEATRPGSPSRPPTCI